MKKILQFFILLSALLINTYVLAANLSPPGFASSEHLFIGNNTKIYFSTDDPGQTAYTFHLQNGLALNYGKIVTMADFYGIPNQPISAAKSDERRKERFLKIFAMFTINKSAVQEAEQILAVIYNEQKLVDEGMKNGERPEDIYNKLAADNDRKWNCITGGGCGKYWYFKPGRYFTLTLSDFDHFGDSAWVAYETGHKLAIEQAIAAHQTQDKQKLELAYMINAFACHYLSDHFATGHMRNPRIELFTHTFPHIIGNALTLYMHNEENHYGLHVHNLRGDHWQAYGDKNYFDKINQENRIKVEEAMQVSANEIFAAYLSGIVPKDDAVYQIIPYADSIGGDHDHGQDIAPLFYWDAKLKRLYRRVDVTNVNDHHWTSHWQGWSTLIELAFQKKLSPEMQAQLIAAGYGEQARNAGLLTDRE